MSTDLTDDERTMLAIERKWWQYPGAKEVAVRDQLDVSMTTYYQRLADLVYTEAAIAHDPITCRRLRARIEQASKMPTRSLRRA